MKPRNVIIAGLIVGALLWALSARAQQPTVQWQAVQQAITNIQSQLNSLQTQITKINNSGIASTPAHDLLITEGGSFTLFNMPLDTFLLGNGASVDPSALAVPNCTDATGNHLNYSTNTHTLSCGTSSSGGSNITAGAGDFNACTQTGA